MSYAVRNDGRGWRAVGSRDDVGSEEWYSAEQPPDPVPLPPTPNEILAAVKVERDRLLALAAIRIAPLQDAVELDESTADEVSLLKVWKQYRVALNRIDQQAGFPIEIDWPILPESDAKS